MITNNVVQRKGDSEGHVCEKKTNRVRETQREIHRDRDNYTQREKERYRNRDIVASCGGGCFVNNVITIGILCNGSRAVMSSKAGCMDGIRDRVNMVPENVTC
jgi:hypothetical protein